MTFVTHVIPNIGYGGAEVMLRDLVDAQLSMGLSVQVISLWPNAETSLDRDLSALCAVTYLDKAPGFDPFLYRKLGPHLTSDVVHTHRDAFRYVWMNRDRPYAWVHTLHNEPGLEASTSADRRIRRRVFRKGSCLPVALSEGLASQYADFYGLQPHQIRAVANGVPEPTVRPQFDSALRRGIFIGRLVSTKDPLRLVPIMKRFRALSLMDSLDIYGQGDLETSLQRAVDVAGLSDCIRLMGIDPHIRAGLPNYDVLLNTSEAEGLPISILEAAAAGLGVIAPDVGAISEALGHGNPGLVGTSRTPDEYATALSLLTGEVRSATTARIHESYSARIMAAHYLNSYDYQTRQKP